MKRRNLSKIDLTGTEKGMLKIIERVPNTKSLWRCECKCGKQLQINTSRLLDYRRKSCGCLGREINKNFGENNKTHGLSKTRLYKVYRSMIDRCYNPNIKNYKDYGARGITVCEKWLESFGNFAKWSYENGYSESKDRVLQSIDRIDVNGNYEPSNCRWADSKTQAINKRSTYEVYYKGDRTSISEICEIYKITNKTFAYNRFKKGYSIEEIIRDWNEKENTPQYLMECSEYAKEIGVCTASVRRMIRDGKLEGEKRGRKWYVIRK